MRYRFVRKRYFVVLSIVGSARGHLGKTERQQSYLVDADIIFFDLLALVE